MAKKITIRSGKSKIAKKGKRKGRKTCRKTASNGTINVTGKLNR
jgi:hypothetical protein